MQSWFQNAPDCEIGVKLPGLDLTLAGPDDLENLHESDVRRVQSLAITAGPYSGPGVKIDVKGDSSLGALEVSVRNPDRARAEGLLKRLSDQLDTGRRWPKWYERSYVLLAIVPVLAGLVIGGISAVEAIDQSRGARIAEFLTVFLMVCLLLFYLWWATPGLELLVPGQQTRWERTRRRFVATVMFVLAVAGTTIAFIQWL